MAYSVNKLITNAFYLSKVRSKDFQTVGGDDIAVGLDLFNKILSSHSANTKMIPFYKETTFNAIIGQEKYFIPFLVEPLSLTFNMTTVRYATNKLSRRRYHATTRIDDVLSLPFNASFERVLGGCDLYVQYLPSDTYPFKVWGKFALDLVSSIESATIVNAGTGYQVGDILSLVNIPSGNNGKIKVLSVGSSGEILTYVITSAGSNYASGVTYATSGGTGTNATFSVVSTDLTTDLINIYEIWYIDYLEHLTAKRICNYYGVPMNPEIQQVIDKISANINNMNPIDLSPQKINFYDDKRTIVNLGNGFTPINY